MRKYTVDEIDLMATSLRVEAPHTSRMLRAYMEHIADSEKKDAIIVGLKNLLAEYTDWEPGEGLQEYTRPTHGSCCTCPDICWTWSYSWFFRWILWC